MADYIVDHTQRTSRPDDHVPDTTVHTALEYADAHSADNIGADNIGHTMRAQGRYQLAHTALTHALHLHTTTHGPHHPNTLNTRHNLASVLWELGRLDQARAEFEAVLATRTEQFGADHPSTLVARHNLALVLRDLGLEEEKDN